jgi:hypothetical protein
MLSRSWSLGERGERETTKGLGLQQHKHPGLEPVFKRGHWTSRSTRKQASRAPPTPHGGHRLASSHPSGARDRHSALSYCCRCASRKRPHGLVHGLSRGLVNWRSAGKAKQHTANQAWRCSGWMEGSNWRVRVWRSSGPLSSGPPRSRGAPAQHCRRSPLAARASKGVCGRRDLPQGERSGQKVQPNEPIPVRSLPRGCCFPVWDTLGAASRQPLVARFQWTSGPNSTPSRNPQAPSFCAPVHKMPRVERWQLRSVQARPDEVCWLRLDRRDGTG